MNTLSSLKPSQAVVVGAGIAGLAAAIALRDRFDSVLLIERSSSEKANPLAAHAHMLLARGFEDLKSLVPDIEARLAKRNIFKEDCAEQIRWYTPLGWTPKFTSGLKTAFTGRSELAALLLDLVTQDPKIELWNDAALTACTSSDHSKIKSIAIYRLGEEVTIQPDIVVNTSGRDGGFYAMLKKIGFDTPGLVGWRRPVVYTSALFAPRQDDPTSSKDRDWKVLAVDIKCTGRRGAFCSREGQNIRVSLLGHADDRNPRNFDEFRAFAKTLADPAVFNITASHELVSEFSYFRSQGDHCREFDGINFPKNVFCVGDAFAYSSPYYGRGMSLAIGEAVRLKEYLANVLPDAWASVEFHKQIRLDLIDPHFGLHKPSGFVKQMLRKIEKSLTNVLWYRGIVHQHAPSYDMLLSIVHMMRPRKDIMGLATLLPMGRKKEVKTC